MAEKAPENAIFVIGRSDDRGVVISGANLLHTE